MRVETIKKEVFSFEDVLKNEDLREKVIEKNRDINVNYEDWYRFTIEDKIEELEKLGYYNIEINFTGFWNQGDGASFTGKLNINEDVLKRLDIKDRFDLIVNYIHTADIRRKTYGGHYYHENTIYSDCNTELLNLDRIDNFLDQKEAELNEAINEEIKELSKGIYKELYESYELLTSDKEILETLECNQYEFTEDGEIF